MLSNSLQVYISRQFYSSAKGYLPSPLPLPPPLWSFPFTSMHPYPPCPPYYHLDSTTRYILTPHPLLHPATLWHNHRPPMTTLKPINTQPHLLFQIVRMFKPVGHLCWTLKSFSIASHALCELFLQCFNFTALTESSHVTQCHKMLSLNRVHSIESIYPHQALCNLLFKVPLRYDIPCKLFFHVVILKTPVIYDLQHEQTVPVWFTHPCCINYGKCNTNTCHCVIVKAFLMLIAWLGDCKPMNCTPWAGFWGTGSLFPF